jgi:hypothetical protein
MVQLIDDLQANKTQSFSEWWARAFSSPPAEQLLMNKVYASIYAAKVSASIRRVTRPRGPSGLVPLDAGWTSQQGLTVISSCRQRKSGLTEVDCVLAKSIAWEPYSKHAAKQLLMELKVRGQVRFSWGAFPG